MSRVIGFFGREDFDFEGLESDFCMDSVERGVMVVSLGWFERLDLLGVF